MSDLSSFLIKFKVECTNFGPETTIISSPSLPSTSDLETQINNLINYMDINGLSFSNYNTINNAITSISNMVKSLPEFDSTLNNILMSITTSFNALNKDLVKTNMTNLLNSISGTASGTIVIPDEDEKTGPSSSRNIYHENRTNLQNVQTKYYRTIGNKVGNINSKNVSFGKNIQTLVTDIKKALGLIPTTVESSTNKTVDENGNVTTVTTSVNNSDSLSSTNTQNVITNIGNGINNIIDSITGDNTSKTITTTTTTTANPNLYYRQNMYGNSTRNNLYENSTTTTPIDTTVPPPNMGKLRKSWKSRNNRKVPATPTTTTVTTTSKNSNDNAINRIARSLVGSTSTATRRTSELSSFELVPPTDSVNEIVLPTQPYYYEIETSIDGSRLKVLYSYHPGNENNSYVYTFYLNPASLSSLSYNAYNFVETLNSTTKSQLLKNSGLQYSSSITSLELWTSYLVTILSYLSTGVSSQYYSGSGENLHRNINKFPDGINENYSFPEDTEYSVENYMLDYDYMNSFGNYGLTMSWNNASNSQIRQLLYISIPREWPSYMYSSNGLRKKSFLGGMANISNLLQNKQTNTDI